MSDDRQVPLPSLPPSFPGAWQNIPRDVQRHLVRRLLEQQLVLHDGAAGLIESLYRNDARLPKGLRWTAPASDLWPLVIDDTLAQLAATAVDSTPTEDRAP